MKPEVMSPAGYWPQLHAAIDAGADAVYFGLTHFSARAKVGFTLGELPEVIGSLHRRGVRGYLTFNTLIFEHEIAEAARTIEAIARAGTDALIVQDAGIMRLARRIAPGLELHASTQMSITDSAGVRFAQSLGADRVTLARELSLDEVRRIREETGCPLEIFVHGALCVAYSGQCFSSEAWGGRSANRGQCAQACRLPYELIVDGEPKPLGDARYLLSPGDLYTLREMPAILAAGVSALKIEGRYKDAAYVAVTTSAYRRAVDGSPATREEELQIEQVYSRGLGPYFIKGTDHQAVVRGRAPRHRGVLMGRVVRVGGDYVVVAPEGAAPDIAPLKEGDGVVFDAADRRSPEEPEEGGRIYEVCGCELRFGNGAIRFDRIRRGDLVWRTDRPGAVEVPRVLQKVHVRVTAREGAPLEAEWSLAKRPEVRLTVRSSAPLVSARNQGISAATLREQFGRLGNTGYELGELTMEADGALFAPVSMLNSMRREAVERLEARPATSPDIEIHPYIPARSRDPRPRLNPEPGGRDFELHLLVRAPEQLDAAIEFRPASITLDYLDLYGLRPSIGRVKAAGIPARVASPRVLKPGEARIANFLISLDCAILVRPAGLLHILRGKERRELVGDFSLNTANSLAAAEYLKLGLSRLTPGHDLNAAQVAQLASDAGGEKLEAIAYHHLPVFHTEHCVFCRFLSTGTSYRDCGRPCEKHRVELRDRQGRGHPVLADVGCRNTVFGAEAQQASEHLARWRSAGIRRFRLEFAGESAVQVSEISRAFAAALSGRMTAGQLNRELKRRAPQGITEGSLFVPANSAHLVTIQ